MKPRLGPLESKTRVGNESNRSDGSAQPLRRAFLGRTRCRRRVQKPLARRRIAKRITSTSLERVQAHRACDSQLDASEKESPRDPDPKCRAQNSAGTLRPVILPLACPFAKLDPVRFRACRLHKFRENKEVKQHIRRRHHDAKDGSSLPDAQVPQTSEVATGKITDAQRDALNKYLNRRLSREEQWYEIWDLLFSGTPQPGSVYAESEGEAALSAMRHVWRHKNTEILNNLPSCCQSQRSLIIDLVNSTIDQLGREIGILPTGTTLTNHTINSLENTNAPSAESTRSNTPTPRSSPEPAISPDSEPADSHTQPSFYRCPYYQLSQNHPEYFVNLAGFESGDHLSASWNNQAVSSMETTSLPRYTTTDSTTDSTTWSSSTGTYAEDYQDPNFSYTTPEDMTGICIPTSHLAYYFMPSGHPTVDYPWQYPPGIMTMMTDGVGDASSSTGFSDYYCADSELGADLVSSPDWYHQ